VSTNPVTPSADQLAAARTNQWHQNGEALLTFENLRSWINAAGLALYNPRATQLPAPAPSMVEAVLGTPNAAPTLADAEQARSLLARLIAEGAAVPLNLLGNPTGTGTETPDFIAATAVLPYIFTLRGDKAWKQPPTTTGPSKVSPLAQATHTALAEKGSLSAYDLATQLGKEVTEAAVLRALTELWQHLRVLPIPQQDGAATLWELTSSRFTKQLKAGSNAGQPTALSALISLYLGQAIVASEEEIEIFLSPLAARSRIRDVVHALLSARQIETIAIEGRTVLHVAGDLPVFLATPATESVAVPVDDIDDLVVTSESDDTAGTPEPRIKKFIPTPRKIGTGFVTKPGLDKPARKPFGASPSPRERRPFTRESNRPDRPSFTKPWAEEKADRLAGMSVPSRVPEESSASASSEPGEASTPPAFERRPAYDRKPSYDKKPSFGSKPSFGRKPFGDKPSYGSRPSYGAKPGFSRDRNDSRPPRRDFAPRPAAEGGNPGDFAPRKTFSKPGTFGRKREGGFSPRPSFGRDGDSRPPRREFTPRPGGEGRDSRPPRRDFGARPTFGTRPPREGGFDRSERSERPSRPPYAGSSSREGSSGRFNKPSYPPRESAGSESTGPRYRKFDAPRGDRPSRPFNSDRPARPFNSERPSRPSSGGYAGKSSAGYAGKSGGYEGKSSSYGDKKPYGKSSGGYAGKSSSPAGKKPFSKSGSYGAKPGKPAGTFDKFKNNAKPFGKRPPARKWKPEETKSAE
jgi:23S rRNA pseudouridine2605 synthase